MLVILIYFSLEIKDFFMLVKKFGLITHLPENVTRWIGQQVQNLGEHQDEQRTRMIFGAATSKGEGAALNTVRMGNRGKIGNKAFPLAGAEGGGGVGEEDYGPKG